MAMAEVTVRGAGIFGLSIAWACALRGARVRVIDPGGPGAGASGGIVGALAPHVPETWNDKKAFQFESLVMAEPFWAGVEETGGVRAGYDRTGRVQPIPDAPALDLARARAQTARDLWQGRFSWTVTEDPGPFAPPSPTGWYIFDTLTARIHPRRACAALAAALTARGVDIATDGADEGVVIHATGAVGLKELGRAGGAVKGQAALLRHDAGDAPQVFVDGLHIVPHADGTVAIGSTSEREYDDPTATDGQLDALIDRARALMPVLHGAEVVERWAGLRPRARSRAPMLGAHPLHEGQFIANGGFKIGFGLAPLVGETMADLLLGARDTIPPEFRQTAPN